MKPRLHPELYAARELVELRLLSATLDALVTALRIEHPTLEDLHEPTDAPTLLAARRLLEQTRHLRAELRACGSAVRRGLNAPLLDDLLF